MNQDIRPNQEDILRTIKILRDIRNARTSILYRFQDGFFEWFSNNALGFNPLYLIGKTGWILFNPLFLIRWTLINTEFLTLSFYSYTSDGSTKFSKPLINEVASVYEGRTGHKISDLDADIILTDLIEYFEILSQTNSLKRADDLVSNLDTSFLGEEK